MQRSLALWPLSLLLLGQLYPAEAQILSDETLGEESSQLRRQGTQITIDGGSDRAPILFHSFEHFNIAEDQQVFFANPQGIDAIISRITGHSPSNIDGTLGVLGTADLFLLNPNGIVFGPNAQLDIAGSFSASTADSIGIDDFDFSAVNPTPVPLLTVNVKPGIQLGLNAPDRLIQNNGTLSLERGQELTLEAGTIDQAGQIRIPAGTVQLQADRLQLTGTVDTRAGDGPVGAVGILQVRSPSNLTIQPTGPLTNQAISDALQTNEVVVESDRTLTLRGPIFSNSPFPLTLRAGHNLRILKDGEPASSLLSADTHLYSGNNIRIANPLHVNASQPNPQLNIQSEGRVVVTADNQPLVDNNFPIVLTGRGGRVLIHANAVSLLDRGKILTFSTDAGRGPNVEIIANQRLTLRTSAIGTRSMHPNQTPGHINIGAGHSVNLVSQSAINTFSPGPTLQTGNITIQTAGPLLLESSTLQTQSSGSAGDITLIARDIFLDGRLGQSLVAADTLPESAGNAGDIILDAKDSIELIGNLPGPFIIPDAQQLGLANILFQVFGNTTIQSSAFGSGRAGTIYVNTDRLRLSNGVLIGNSAGLSDASNQPSGDILVTTREIYLQGVAAIGTGTIGAGDAGTLEIQSDRIHLDDGAVIAVSTVLGSGSAGNLIIDTNDLTLTDGSVVGANSIGGGNGGVLEIRARSITVDGTSNRDEDGRVFPSSILTDASSMSMGPGGELRLRTNDLQVLNGGQIRASTSGIEDAGNITIIADRTVISGVGDNGTISTIEAQSTNPDQLEDVIGKAGTLRWQGRRLTISDEAQITTESVDGDGGDIFLNLDEALVLRRQGRITSTAGTAQQGGNGGNITINAGFIIAPELENSDIVANAFTGTGGRIDIQTNGLLLGIALRDEMTDLSDITASSDSGLDGTVTIEEVGDELAPAILQLPRTLANSQDQLVTGCLLDEDANFVVTGRGGIPANPSERLNQPLIWQDPRLISDVVERGLDDVSDLKVIKVPDVREAQGWYINEEGQAELISSLGSLTLTRYSNC